MIRPLPGYCLIEPIEDDSKTSGGLYLPEVSKDKPSKGRITSLSSLLPYSGKWIALDHESNATLEYEKLKVGVMVLYKKWTNQEVTHEGKEYLLVHFNELLAVIE